jgi:hypothetical protein
MERDIGPTDWISRFEKNESGKYMCYIIGCQTVFQNVGDLAVHLGMHEGQLDQRGGMRNRDYFAPSDREPDRRHSAWSRYKDDQTAKELEPKIKRRSGFS